MYARSEDGLRWPAQQPGAAFATVARVALTILCLAAVAAAVPSARYLIFEYNHGDRQIVQRLFDSLCPSRHPAKGVRP
jgi:hypothetical protein